MKNPFPQLSLSSALASALMGLLLSLPLTTAWANANPAACYRFEMTDSPESNASYRSHYETWCYQNLSSPHGSTYIFNADQEKVRAELAIVVEPDGQLTHGSMLAGQLSVHRVRAKSFNPFSIPLQEPRNLPPILGVEILSSEMLQSAQEVLSFLLSHQAREIDIRVDAGHFESSVATELLPWRGYWWPYRNLPLSGPLGKYDRFVRARTGTNPGAQRWENGNHRYHGIVWEGHCNGWAASSVLRKEPAFAKRDPASGVIFSIVDQKGILAETDYCATIGFFGNRYRGGRDDIRDIYPALFHKVLTYYIGEIGKPVAIDYKRDSSVDNHIISGYQMDIEKTGVNSYLVTTRLKMHKYDGSRVAQPGVAPEYSRIYKYTLTTDEAGIPVSGSWRSTNPDFLWVPLASSDCTKNNPRIDHAMTAEILDLPAAP